MTRDEKLAKAAELEAKAQKLSSEVKKEKLDAGAPIVEAMMAGVEAAIPLQRSANALKAEAAAMPKTQTTTQTHLI